MDKDPWPKKYDNTISALTEVELTRRLAHHRELSGEKRSYPGASWMDIQVKFFLICFFVVFLTFTICFFIFFL
jgi:hypothetical protein